MTAAPPSPWSGREGRFFARVGVVDEEMAVKRLLQRTRRQAENDDASDATRRS